MIEFLKGLFGSGGGGGRGAPRRLGKEEAAVEYNDFHISPCPRKVTGGWSTEGIIRKNIGGEIKEHIFIRADTSITKESAISLIVGKSKTLIDQRGDGIFS